MKIVFSQGSQTARLPPPFWYRHGVGIQDFYCNGLVFYPVKKIAAYSVSE